MAAERGYRSVETKAELRRLGFSASQCNTPALLVPIRNVHGEIANYQARPDEPRIGRNGKPIKYETPCRSRMVLDVPHRVRQNLDNPAVPLFVTEGARKADSAVSLGLCCIALLGVWNWRGSNDHGGKVALPDWEAIALTGREVYVAFDSDAMTKHQVHAAMTRLTVFLEGRGARVHVVYLPAGQGGVKTGLDDFFAAGHCVEDLLALAEDELRKLPARESDEATGPYSDVPGIGLVWNKTTREGVVPVPLTNFSARIVGDIANDDGVERRHRFEIEARRGEITHRFEVTAEKFQGLSWVNEHMGAGAIIWAGIGLKDHARAAIQYLSQDAAQRTVFIHTGWRPIDSRWVYLHAGGAIGAEGAVESLETRLPVALAPFILPDPPVGDELLAAIRSSFAILDLAPDPVTFPALGAVYRSVLGGVDFAVHLAGPSGVSKSELAALMQQHFGAGFDARHLPGSWSSTGNSLEAMAFTAKDAIYVVDDFAPGGSRIDVQRIHREADRLLRAQGNRSGRGRMRADGSLAATRFPRGLIVSTGEDVPAGHSLRARLVILPMGPGSIESAALTRAQAAGADGAYAKAMAGFLRAIAPRHEDVHESLRRRARELRDKRQPAGGHARTPTNLAELEAAFGVFVGFARSIRALNRVEAEALTERCSRAMDEAASDQSALLASADPIDTFLGLLRSAISAGEAHVAAQNGTAPGDLSDDGPIAYGWRPRRRGQETEWDPCGYRVGWIAGEDLFLDLTAAHRAAQNMAGETDRLGIAAKTLARRLDERGILVSKDEGRGKHYVRRTLQGKRRAVLHLRSSELEDGTSSQVRSHWSPTPFGRSAKGIPGTESRDPTRERKVRSVPSDGPRPAAQCLRDGVDGTWGPKGPNGEEDSGHAARREEATGTEAPSVEGLDGEEVGR